MSLYGPNIQRIDGGGTTIVQVYGGGFIPSDGRLHRLCSLLQADGITVTPGYGYTQEWGSEIGWVATLVKDQIGGTYYQVEMVEEWFDGCGHPDEKALLVVVTEYDYDNGTRVSRYMVRRRELEDV